MAAALSADLTPTLTHPLAAGGLPTSHPGTQKKSYATALIPDASTDLSLPNSPAVAPSLGLHKGFPSISFEDSHIQTLSAPFGKSLIGKFAMGYNKINPKLGRPSAEDIHRHLLTMDFKDAFTVGLMDNRHVWIRFSNEEDYHRLYSRPVWHVGGKPMRIFKWMPYFRPDIESSLVPIWVKFPRLPLQFFHKSALFPIASLIGLPLRPDSATISLKRPSVARIQIEIDLLKPINDKIWITLGSGGGYWQAVEYESIPPYCTHCMHVGHSETLCTVHNPELAYCDKKQPRQWVKKTLNDVQAQRNLDTELDSQGPAGKGQAGEVLTSQEIGLKPQQIEIQNAVITPSTGAEEKSNSLENMQQDAPVDRDPQLVESPQVDKDSQPPTAKSPDAKLSVVDVDLVSAPFGSSVFPEASPSLAATPACQVNFPSVEDESTIDTTLAIDSLNLVEQPVLVGIEEDSNYSLQMNAIESSQPVCKKTPMVTLPLPKSAAPHDEAMPQENALTTQRANGSERMYNCF